MNDKVIIDLIEKTLEEKTNINMNYIKYTYYELRVKYNLSEQDINRFLYLLQTKLQNTNYTIYYIGDKYKYNNEEQIVKDNELIVAIKEEKEEPKDKKRRKHFRR